MKTRPTGMAAKVAVVALALVAVAACDRFGLSLFQPQLAQNPGLDATTRSTPLVVGRVVDEQGRPVEGAEVRLYEGLYTAHDGVTQTIPVDGTTQTTPIDGTTQTTPLDGSVQTTPFDGSELELQPDERTTTGAQGQFALRSPSRRVLAIEAWDQNHNRAARIGIEIDQGATRLDLGTLQMAPEAAASGKVLTPPGVPVEESTVFVPGTDHMVRVDASGAYALGELPPGVTRIAAVHPKLRPAVASGLTLRPGGTTAVPDLVLEPERPVLSLVSPAIAGPGAEVVLKGEGFGRTALRPVDVRFNRLKATQISRISDGEIRVVVPSGAQSGPLDVVVEGIASEVRPFTVVASVSLGPGEVRQTLGEVARFQVVALDDKGADVSAMSLNWAVEPHDLGTIDSASGEFRAARTGFGTLTVGSGRVMGSAALGFGDWQFTTVLAPADPEHPDEGPLEGKAGSVRFKYPYSIALFPGGDLAFTDVQTEYYAKDAAARPLIRTLSPDGTVRGLAGTGTPGYGGDGLAALASPIGAVGSVAVGSQGQVIFVDATNFRIRALLQADGTLLGRDLAAGRLWNLIGTGDPGPSGRGKDGLDGPDPLAVGLAMPRRVALGSGGCLLLLEAGNESISIGTRIREVDTTGVRTLLDSKGRVNPESASPMVDPSEFVAFVRGLLPDSAGNIYLGTTSGVWMLCRKTGRYFGVDALQDQVVRIAGTGKVNSFNGEEGPARQINLWAVDDMAWLGNSMLLVDSANQRVRLMSADGHLISIAGGPAGPVSVAGLAIGARLNNPGAVAAGAGDSFFIADKSSNRILRFWR